MYNYIFIVFATLYNVHGSYNSHGKKSDPDPNLEKHPDPPGSGSATMINTCGSNSKHPSEIRTMAWYVCVGNPGTYSRW